MHLSYCYFNKSLYFYITDKILIKMITLKEYEIYLTVKNFIETMDENDLIP